MEVSGLRLPVTCPISAPPHGQTDRQISGDVILRELLPVVFRHACVKVFRSFKC